MPAIIRLSRHGKKGQAFYHIVVADSRFARDARFIEKIGTYNPRTNPVTVNLKFDNAVAWIQKGAKPSDTMRSILSDKGVMYKVHLLKGVKKGVLTPELAETKFAQWVTEKESKQSTKKNSLDSSKKDALKKRVATEAVAREARNAKRREKQAKAEVPSNDAPAAEAQA